MKLLAIVTLFLVICLVNMSLLIPALAQGGEVLPYIYYYSSEHKGWIVERTDGSDRVIMTLDPGCRPSSWSPSGRWIMQYCDHDTSDSTPGGYSAINLINGRTLTTLALFAGFPTSPRLEWSPTGEDLILVSTIFKPHQPDEEPQSGPGVYVINANQDQFVLEKTFDEFSDCAEWSPNGRFVASYACEGYDSALIIPANGGTEPPILLERATYSSGDWTPDGRLVTRDGESAELTLVDPASGPALTLPFTDESAWAPQWSADGQHGLIYAGSELWLLALDHATLTRVAENVVQPTNDALQFDEWSDTTSFERPGWTPDGSRALFATQEGVLHWLSVDGTVYDVPGIPPHEGNAPTAPMVQWGGPYAFIKWNTVTYLVDLAAEQVVTTFAQTERVYLSDKPLDFDVSPDGRLLAWIGGCTSSTRGACIWDWAAETGVRIMPNPSVEQGYETDYGEIRWHPGGGMVFISEPVAMPGPGYTVYAVASADGRRYRVVNSLPAVLPPQVDPGTIPHTATTAPSLSLVIPAHEKTVGVVAWSPDGSWLASAPADFIGQYYYTSRGGHEVRVWDAVSGEKVGELPLERCSMGAIYAPPGEDNGLLLAAYSPRPAAQENPYSGYITGMDWPHGEGGTELALLLNECDNRYRLLIWDWVTGKVTTEYEDVTVAAFAPGGEQIALGFADGGIVLTAYPAINPADVLTTLSTRVDLLAFSGDGTWLVAASADGEEISGEVIALDLATGVPSFTIPRPQYLRSLTVSPNGAIIALAQREGLFCQEWGEPPTLLDGDSGEALTAYNTDTYAVAFSPDGHIVASGGCHTELWDMETFEATFSYKPIARALAWSPDGERLAVGASFGVFVWDVP